jgi:hypothetical protein
MIPPLIVVKVSLIPLHPLLAVLSPRFAAQAQRAQRSGDPLSDSARFAYQEFSLRESSTFCVFQRILVKLKIKTVWYLLTKSIRQL